jgi:hypothetical protein
LYRLFNVHYLEDYFIKINWIDLYWLPKQALINIIFVDLNNESDILMQRALDRDFEKAIISAERILGLTIKIKKDKLLTAVASYNDYAFCLLNLNDLKKANIIFEQIQDKYFLSKINLAYILFLKDKWQEAKSMLKKILNKHVNQQSKVSLLLAINHNKLSLKNRIVDDVTDINVVLWNLSLISAQYEKEKAKADAFLKKIKSLTESEKIIHKRVLNWIDFYRNNIKDSLEKSKNILNKLDKGTHLYNDILKDIEIFDKNISAKLLT